MPAPRLVVQTQAADGEWEDTEPVSTTVQVMDAAVADQIKQILSDGQLATAITGSGGQTLAWYSGFGPFDDPQYAVAVMLEDGDLPASSAIGRAILAAAVGH
jgi:hypothetical protein